VLYDVTCPIVDRKKLRFMPRNSVFATAAAYESMIEAGYTAETLPAAEMAVLNGCAGGTYSELSDSVVTFIQSKNMRKISPFSVPRVMPSSAVATLSLLFGITGESYDISCACTSGAMSVIAGARLILSGEYDIVMVGGSEELSWQQALGFNVMKAVSRGFNSTPEKASRPFDKQRDGFVMAEGAGMLILESEEHAKSRNAKIYGYISGFAANSNAVDMVAPDRASSAAVMAKAVKNAGLKPEDISYINTHGTSTPVGDPIEMNAIRDVFGNNRELYINSTKSQTGHMIGATGAVEIIYSNLMLENSFISPNLNLEDVDDDCAWANIPRKTVEGCDLKYALSNSFGFGGSNASVVISRSDM